MILSFITSILFIINHLSPEQEAFNYFAKEIAIKYKYKYIFISGQTEEQQRIDGPFVKCFDANNNSVFYHNNQLSVLNKIPIEYGGFPNFKKSLNAKKRNLYLRIYRSVEKSGFMYTYIKVYEINVFVDHYLVKADLNGNEIIDICHVKETI